ncbi:putative ribosome biogenesis protein [Cyclospora cayetanensis]|uniref:Ribosome biogenesis protein n=1 Tax=Cyclospora cayetanensis TaxID=88456 RepID=A0A1D3CUS9_9EIME|nr:putative ribosome biogenesis protein [Cyclospora cayetanensis]
MAPPIRRPQNAKRPHRAKKAEDSSAAREGVEESSTEISAAAASTPASAVPEEGTARSSGGGRSRHCKKGGDPERRKACSIHALLKRVSLANKPIAADADPPSPVATKGTSNDEEMSLPSGHHVPPASGAERSSRRTAASQGEEGTASSVEASQLLQSEEELSLFMFDFGECDAQRCSGRRLLRHAKLNRIGEAASDSGTDEEEEIEEAPAANTAVLPESSCCAAEAAAEEKSKGLVRVRIKGGCFRGVLLSPYFDEKTQIFSAADRRLMRQQGLAVVDCSWNRVLEGRRSQRINFLRSNVRVLPLLLCGNPTHYGAPNILTCAEALAGALFIAGYKRHAELLLNSFTWGAHFLELNKSFLDVYASVPNGQAMKKLKDRQEAEMLQKRAEKEAHKRNDNTDYSAIYTTVEETVLGTER